MITYLIISLPHWSAVALITLYPCHFLFSLTLTLRLCSRLASNVCFSCLPSPRVLLVQCAAHLALHPFPVVCQMGSFPCWGWIWSNLSLQTELPINRRNSIPHSWEYLGMYQPLVWSLKLCALDILTPLTSHTQCLIWSVNIYSKQEVIRADHLTTLYLNFHSKFVYKNCLPFIFRFNIFNDENIENL